MKTAKDYLDAANAEVTRLSSEQAVARHGNGNAVFVDVRDSAAIAQTGTIEGALRVPRGFIEFAADEGGPYREEALRRDADLYLVCGAGGQAALAGRTLKEMGFASVTNIGGIGGWKEAGGAMEGA
jgi:rhodanese-related sulfurtransferase